MFERLAINGREFEEKTLEHVSEYADAGLRTLILAYRELDEEEYNEFDKKLSEAKITVTMDHESLIEEISEKIERNLILLGATAVEDKLQNGVTKKIISHAKINIYQLDQDLKLRLTIFFFC
jgi:phospholipid-translocating ATPase